jgi:predicted RNA-binding Zn-ribbon protein involved in translation (DUF1610 family)
MAKDDFKGYAARFAKAGDIVRETITESACPECGVRGMYTRQWRSDGKKQTVYHIRGTCPNGHEVERYGHGAVA